MPTHKEAEEEVWTSSAKGSRGCDTMEARRMWTSLVHIQQKRQQENEPYMRLTMIDPATGWFEVAPLEEPNSYSTQKAFDSILASTISTAESTVDIDNGKHFMKYFKDLIDNYGLIHKSSTDYNPQSNGIIERVHQVLGNALRNFEIEDRELDDQNPWDEFLVPRPSRSEVHTTLLWGLRQLN
jgi:hypothetical protein